MLPFAAGWSGPFRLLSWFRMAPGPLPDAFCANSAGAEAPKLNGYATEARPAYSIHTEGLATFAISYGATAEICLLLA